MPRIATSTSRSLVCSIVAAALLGGAPTALAQNRNQDADDSYSPQYDQRSSESLDDQERRSRFRDRGDRTLRQDRRDDRSRGYDDAYEYDDAYQDDRSSQASRSDNRDDGDQQRFDAQHGGQPAGLGVSAAAGRRGVRILRVVENSPADEAGLQQGDEILAVDGNSIDDGRDLTRIIRRQEPGSRIRMRILRDGEERTLTATLEPLREALRDGRDQADGRSRRFYRGLPPWGDDQLMQHVDHLERHIQQLQRELHDLRQMLSSDPGYGRFDRDRDNRRFSDRGDRFDDDRRFSDNDDRSYDNRGDSRR